MELPVSTIGEKLKNIRISRGLSLEDVSHLTGVSKPMLGQIERGQSIPTITTLWKIATGLKTPLSSFLEEPQPEYVIAQIDGQSVIEEDNGRMRAYPLFAYDPIRSVETFYIEFDSGCHRVSDKHNKGVEEYVFVLTGKIQLVLGEKEVVVGQKQALRFRADIPHAYHNPFDQICTIYNTIFYPSR